MDQLLKPVEAAEYMRTTVRQLENLRYRREGPEYVKRGATVLYRISAIERYLARCTVKTSERASA